MTRKDRREPWTGGYIHWQKDGRPLYIIERRVHRERFHISTRCHSLEAAEKQLRRFEADPLGYSPAGDANSLPLRLTAELGDKFHDWQLAKGNTAKHANEMANRISDWMEDLQGMDLRKLSLRDHIKPALDRHKGSRAHRIIALKSFYAWLRKERHLLTSAQDPTLDLPVPQAVPEKQRRRKAVDFENVRAAAQHLAPAYRDALVVLAHIGWHVTELERLIRDPESEIVHVRRDGVIAVLIVRHKIGDKTRTPVTDRAVLAAAERLRDGGVVPRRMNDALKLACRAAGVPEFTYGVMRHSVATWAVDQGSDPKDVSAFLNHRDPRTTARFYTDQSIPTVTVTVPRLRVIKGGKPTRKKSSG